MEGLDLPVPAKDPLDESFVTRDARLESSRFERLPVNRLPSGFEIPVESAVGMADVPPVELTRPIRRRDSVVGFFFAVELDPGLPPPVSAVFRRREAIFLPVDALSAARFLLFGFGAPRFAVCFAGFESDD